MSKNTMSIFIIFFGLGGGHVVIETVTNFKDRLRFDLDFGDAFKVTCLLVYNVFSVV